MELDTSVVVPVISEDIFRVTQVCHHCNWSRATFVPKMSRSWAPRNMCPCQYMCYQGVARYDIRWTSKPFTLSHETPPGKPCWMS